MNQVGNVGLIAALAFAVYGIVAGAVGGKLRSLRVVRSAERSALAFFVLITLAVVALEALILRNDFHNAYVAAHSNRDLPTYYKIAVLWAGQEGSLLFWTWLLSIYGGAAVLLNRRKNRQLIPYVVAMLMATGAFFASITFFVANPFSELSVVSAAGTQPFAPMDGNGLNPLLQYHSMVIHPPMLYLDTWVLLSRSPSPWQRSSRGNWGTTGFGPRAAGRWCPGCFWEWEFCWAGAGPIRCWAGAAIGAGTRWRMPRCFPGFPGPHSCTP